MKTKQPKFIAHTYYINKGETPLRIALYFILILRTAYGLNLAFRAGYGLWHAQAIKLFLVNVSFIVLAR